MKTIHWVGTILAATSLLLITLTGCSKAAKKTYDPTSTISLDIKDSTSDITSETTQMWHTENGKIMVLFGYGFNDDVFVTEAKSVLDSQFGLSENGGIIIPVVFPNDFRHKDKAVTTDLFNIIDDNSIDLKGLVIMGAPENTHRALAKMQDLWEGEIPYPVFTFFPQDDVLGIEDTSDIVIDRIQKAEMETNLTEESEVQDISDAKEILINAVRYLLCTETGPAKDAHISGHAMQMLPNKKIRRYSDSETGLFALNHFVVE